MTIKNITDSNATSNVEFILNVIQDKVKKAFNDSKVNSVKVGFNLPSDDAKRVVKTLFSYGFHIRLLSEIGTEIVIEMKW